MRVAMMMVLLLGCPPADEGGSSDQEQTSTGGEGETEVIVERVDEGEGDDGRLSDQPPQTRGATCTSSADCPDGQQCWGEAGCDVAWTCGEPRMCTRDLVTYCSCNGETVQGSGSCPPEPYSARGACEG